MQVFVGNISYKATEDDLRKAFEAAGVEVENVRIMKDYETQRSKGFGFVTLGACDMDNVIKTMNGADVCGRTIAVDRAKSQSNGRR